MYDVFPKETLDLRMEHFSDVGGRELYGWSYSILELESCPPWARGLKYPSIVAKGLRPSRAPRGHVD